MLPSCSRLRLLSIHKVKDRINKSMPVLLFEVEPPGIVRYLIGATIMTVGVVLPLAYMMFRTKRVPSTSTYAKQT
ncbi:hypothetical protein O6H91_02G092600 [Diphasiastrum complanatum]|uniref:Uncharacterized protein n=2 Tax=Diphasiastrum complanatum TaxID=34168 RepID=A0ACC2EI81_DIPCM|nr:hypothetical protein O6H91_02G092600 [Diphasiastrum complanatum]KAJ7566216.1 hypothetical protein O6H91_02G092600 [Diphasiastrum complanatum]